MIQTAGRGGEQAGAGPGGEGPDDDAPIVLYIKRKQIYPKLVFGKFRALKWAVLFATLGVYYLLPWIRWDRGPGASNQAVLADMEGGRFYFFWIELWPQEVYYITGLLILAAMGLFLVTALFGRVWCGYTCPQTVWTDLFIAVERMFEGDRSARIRLDKAPWSIEKAARKTGKHAVWLLIAFMTGGAWILYWHDAPTLARTFFVGEAPATAYVFAGLLTLTTYALAGTMREQVCTYLCPWPRIQSGLIDKDSLAVTYRSDRGDPRGAFRKGDSWEGRGDCVDCNQCVMACPQGIDIRHGLQLECIHCALCIDACDAVMKKVGRPTGLIAYDTDENVVRRWLKQAPNPFRPVRSRTIVYAVVSAITVATMTWGLATRTDLSVSVIKDRSLPFTRMSTGEIRNAYTIKVINKAHETRTLAVSVDGVENAKVELVGELDPAAHTIVSEADGVDRYRVFVTAPADTAGRSPSIRITVRDGATGEEASGSAPFSTPMGVAS
ncbi:cytochrome c oxidase accessory protein CcoG [bacterium]|nr:cytochrome c oxidase accessory protein CcoG [bacterium]